MDDGQIWTDTRFHVIELEKSYIPDCGSPTWRRYQNLHSHVEGALEFRPGGEVICSCGEPGNRFNVVGWSQGTLRIRRDSHTGTETVTQDSAEIRVYDPAAQG